MPAPICVNCQIEMRCEQNDYLVNDVHTLNFGSTYWLGDLFECPACDAKIVVGCGKAIDDQTLIDLGLKTGGSLTFAYEPEQHKTHADQFQKPAAVE